MNFRIFLSLTLLLAVASTASAQNYGAKEYRDFQDQSGQTVRARLMQFDGTNALLRMSAGKDIPVAVANLSPADQEYVKNWDPNERVAPTGTPDSSTPSGPSPLVGFLEEAGYTAVPFEVSGKSVLIPVFVNDEEFEFLFDVGRPLSLIHRAIADRMGSTEMDIEFGEFPTATGIEKVYAAPVDSFRVGAATIEMFEVGTADLVKLGFGDVDGVLGGDVLYYFYGYVDWGSNSAFFRNSGD